MTLTDTGRTSPTPADRPSVYFPMPSVPLLLTELAQEHFWASYARVHDDTSPFTPRYLADRERAALLLRAVLADLYALADPGNRFTAQDAERAAAALRRHDGPSAYDGRTARAWMRDQYAEWNANPTHPPNCPGGCGGSGEVTQTLTWDLDTGRGLHAEPVWCKRGAPEDPHPDCDCRGTGFVVDRERRERNICLGYAPQLLVPPAAPARDPWASPDADVDDDAPF